MSKLHSFCLAALALLFALTAPGPHNLHPIAVAQVPAQANFATITPAEFTIQDLDPVEVSIALTEAPQAGAKPSIFLEADGARFSACRLDFDDKNWNQPQKVAIIPKATFEPPAQNSESVFAMRFGYKDDPKGRHKATHTIKFKRNVTPSRLCSGAGDPHYVTFDGLLYNFYGGGCYTLFQSESLVVQSLLRLWPTNQAVSNHAGVAIAYGSTMFRVDALAADPNNCVQQLSPRSDGIDLQRSENKFDLRFVLADGAVVWVIIHDNPNPQLRSMDVQVIVPPCYKSKSRGMCGPYDDNKGNDFTMPNGNIAPDANAFANSWKVPEAEDMFVKGYDSSIKAKLKAPATYHTCSLPTDDIMNATGIAPPPQGYQEAHTQQQANAQMTPLPEPAKIPVKERKDKPWTDFVTGLCEKAIKFPGSELLKNVPGPENYIKSCVMDSQLLASVDTIDGYRIGYQRELHSRISEEIEKFKICEATGKPRPRSAKELADFSKAVGMDSFQCPARCNGKGNCMNFGCQCNTGFTLYDCSLDLKAAMKRFLDAEAQAHAAQANAAGNALAAGNAPAADRYEQPQPVYEEQLPTYEEHLPAYDEQPPAYNEQPPLDEYNVGQLMRRRR